MSTTTQLEKLKKLKKQYVATDYVCFSVNDNPLPANVIERDKRGQNVIVVTFAC